MVLIQKGIILGQALEITIFGQNVLGIRIQLPKLSGQENPDFWSDNRKIFYAYSKLEILAVAGYPPCHCQKIFRTPFKSENQSIVEKNKD